MLFAMMLALAGQAATPVDPTAPAKCMGTLVQFGDGSSKALASFWVAGTEEQLAKIAAAATKIGAIARKPKEIEGSLVLFVFFESSVNGFQAFNLTNEVFKGTYHPGLIKEKIKKDTMFLPASTLKNCKK